jgi:hypothetical protein
MKIYKMFKIFILHSMTTIEFTPRLALYFSRFLELEKDDYIKRVRRLMTLSPEELEREVDKDSSDEMTFTTRYFKGWGITIGVDYEREDGSEEDELPEDYKPPPIKPDSLTLNCQLFKRSDCENEIEIGRHTFFTSFWSDQTIDDKTWIYSLVKIYHLCPCGQWLAKKDGWCSHCYPYVCSQEEECCVCRENEGVWYELECKHTIHEYCWKRVHGLKCPLCRHEHKHKFYGTDRI